MTIVTEIGQLLLLLLLSATKFLFAPAAFLAAGYSPWLTIILNFFGGSFGSIFFLKLGQRIFSWWYGRFPRKKQRLFSRSNRLLVQIKSNFGVFGIAFVLPIISVPISAILAAKYFMVNRRTILIFVGVCAFWSVLITLFSDNIIQFLASLW